MGKQYIKIVIGGILLSILIIFTYGVRGVIDVPFDFSNNVLSGTEEKIQVQKVIDGDTIRLVNGQTVRYIGIDTPENPKSDQKECYSNESFLANMKLVENKYVRLESDVTDRDRYGRLLRYVWVMQPDGQNKEIMVNAYLVQEGYARVATYPPDVKYAKYLTDLQGESRFLEKGLWSSCLLVMDSQFDRNEYECSINIYDCSDFTTQTEAQYVLELCGIQTDIHNLDSDSDGLACEVTN